MKNITKGKLISIIAASAICLSSNAYALSLKESVSEVLQTNPVVQERLKNFREVQQDLKIAQSEYLPTIDYTGSYGLNDAGNIKSSDLVEDHQYAEYTHSLRLTQNLFNGFSTTNKVDYQETRILAAAHNYVENANDIAFQMVQAYIDVLRGYQLLQNAKDNVKINENIYEDVKSLYDTGLTTKSEMTKIFASLSLAKSNLVVQQNNAKEREFRFKRLFGREVDVSTLNMPALDLAMPESLERATQFAIENNPSIIVSQYNVKGSQALLKQKKGNYYPTLDLTVEQVYNGQHDQSETTFASEDDRLSAYLTLSWNLFRGGADAADVQKSRSSIGKEVELLRDLKRQTIEGIELSWSAYDMIGDQLKELYEYNTYSQDTLESYISEYELGRRTLLDLLSAQQDLNNSKAEIINAQLDKLFAQYRILDAMGLLVDVVLGDSAEYNKVIEPTLKPFDIVEDTVPVYLDVDKDGIVDELDVCDNSVAGDNIRPNGCAQKDVDSDFDGVMDAIDTCPLTPFGDIVDANGCTVEGSKNKFEVNKEDYITEIVAYNENSPEKSELLGLYDYQFSTNPDENVKSTELDNELMYGKFDIIKRFNPIAMEEFNAENHNDHLDAIANEIKKYEEQRVVVTIIGNSSIDSNPFNDTLDDREIKDAHAQIASMPTREDPNADAQRSYEAAKAYAEQIKALLVEKGVNADVIVPQSRVDYDRLYLVVNEDNEKLNDRVDVALYVPKATMNDKKEVVAQAKMDNKPTSLDEDGDGVLNEMDKCPGTPAGYVVDADGCAKKIDLKVLFENDSSAIKEDSLDKIKLFQQYLVDFPQYDVVITGHASKNSPQASAAYNTRLSKDRAEAVKAYLVNEGIDAVRIATVGKGFDEPIATNDTPEGQAENRRIIAVLVDKE